MAKKTTLSYSDAIAELETIVNKLQNNEYEIDELQKCTTRSLELLKFCKSKLFETDEALQKILAELNDYPQYNICRFIYPKTKKMFNFAEFSTI